MQDFLQNKPIKDRLRHIFNIRADMAEPSEIRNRVAANAQMTGTNMYVLIAAILIASIGLNMNSTAVIIGAMLISPLMGSIIGIGYGLATKQSVFTRNSLECLIRQFIIAFVTSTLYFLISPVTAPSEEILARTSPTVWDVLIALFGGAAGFVGQTRHDKSNNIIPGVAIATALMPPICTAGYGLANGRWSVMFGALDLFLVNCLCIFAMTFLFTKVLGIDDTPDDMPFSSKLRLRILIIAVLVLSPTAYFAYDYVANAETEKMVTAFINSEFSFDDTQVIKHSYSEDTKILTIALVGDTVSDEQIAEISESMDSYGLSGITLKVTQTTSEKSISPEEIDDIVENKLDEIRKELSGLKEENSSLSEDISKLSEENSSLSEELSSALETITEEEITQEATSEEVTS